MIILGVLSLYVLLIAVFTMGYYSVKPHTFESEISIHSFSMIIPFRDEATDLPALLESLRLLDYPPNQLEVLMVNDASSDQSVQQIQAFIQKHQLIHIQVIENNRQSNSPKKDAIRTAIKLAKHPWLITTDADCMLPSKWLRILDNFIQKKTPNMVAGPLALSPNKVSNRLLYALETLDIHSLLGATVGAFGLGHPIMANGAHLAYRKDIFTHVKGFAGNDHMASGDDLFLLEKFLAYDAKSVHYLKSRQAIVRTAPQVTWRGFVSQRKRWAAKASGFNNAFAKAVGILVFLGNLATLIAYCMLLYAFFLPSYPNHVGLIGGALLLKYLLDGVLIFKALRFTGSVRTFIWYPAIALGYPLLTLMIAILAFTTSYTWKGRRFKQ